MLEPEALGRHKDDLAATLRDLRKRAGFTGERLAARCAMSQSKVSKIETGKVIPSVVDVERILQALSAPPRMLSDVTALAKLANTEFQDTRSLLRKGLEKKQHELSGMEIVTTDFRFFMPAMITTLLSTPEYIRESLAHLQGDTSKAVAKKLERQAVLYDPVKNFSFVLTESAVRLPLGSPAVMALQVDRLVSLSHLSNIQLGIIPVTERPPRGPLNTFTVYDERLVTTETFTGAVVMRDPRDVAFHIDLFKRFVDVALFGDDSVVELNAATGAEVRVIGGFRHPIGISPDGSHVWVANQGSGSVTELNAATGALVQVISGSSYGFNSPMSISSDGAHVWVGNDSDTVTELNAATGTLAKVINGSRYIFNGPDAISSDGTDVWVANRGGESVTGFPAK